MKRSIFTCGALALAAAAFAGGSKVWEHSTQADFEKAKLDKLSLRSDGRLELAPTFRELHDPSTAYLWAVARDSRGHLFVGGSGQDNKARVVEIDAAGKGKALADLPGLEVHAIAIDARDRVYAATSPDGKIYRLRAGAAPETFYDPKAKYIWALAFGKQGELYAATGDKGEIHKIAPDGTGSVFFKTDETHARSMALDAQGNLYVGSEPGGLIFRVTPAGEGFVVHQTLKREVTAVAIAPDGTVYAAAVGAKQAAVAPSAPAPPPPPAPAAANRPAAPSAPTSAGPSPGPPGGSEVIRIESDGYPRRLWSHANDVVYALAFDAKGRALIGTGNKGAIYRLDDDLLYSLLLNAAPTQVTGLAAGPGGAIYAVTGNIGKVYQIGPAFEKEGSIESETLDASYFTYWGRIHFGGTANGGGVKLETRSGNLESTRARWSPWAAVPLNSAHGRIASPAARFLQYRATLSAAADGKSPGLASVDIAYLPKNVAPVVELIDTTPPNYRFPAPSGLTLSTAQSLTLPALSRNPAKAVSVGTATSEAPSSTVNYAKGHIGARWLARDENGDSLLSTVEIRGERESQWKPLKASIRERQLSWDSTAYPDGEYRLRVTVTDSLSNPPHLALQGSLESYPFVIDNSPPRITGLAASRSGMKMEIRWHAADALNTLAKAEYSVDGGDWKAVEPTTRISDSQDHDYVLALDGLAPGEHVIAVRVTDEADNQAVEKIVASLQ